MRQSLTHAFASRVCRLAAALTFAVSLVAVAPVAKAQDAPRSAEQARGVQGQDWWILRDQFQRQPQPAVRRIRRSETPAQDDSGKEEPAEKRDDARIVLVVGDFMAAGLADALTDDYAQSAEIRIVDKTNGSSGLVRTDFYDWQKEIGPIMDSARPSVVVVMLGANDRQAMKVGTATEPPRSDAWAAEYTRRVEALTKAVRDRKIPLVWVGQPAFKYASMSSDMLAFDDIYQRVVEAAGGEYVDIWDGFVGENGAFRFTGPDVNGQPVRLRSDDGITLSKAGKRKVAFYAEKPLNKLLGGAAAPGGTPQPGIGSGIGPANMLAPSPDRTPPISLSTPPVDENADLLGSKIAPKPRITNTAADRLTIEGVAASSPPGRADDFGGAGNAGPAAPSLSGGQQRLPESRPAVNKMPGATDTAKP